MAVSDKEKNCVENKLFFEQVRRLLDENREIRIPVKGTSMQPFLHHMDHVVLKKAVGSDLRLGKIVLAIWKETYILHRIVGKDRAANLIKLAGDGNLAQVENIILPDVMAVVVRVYRADKEVDINSVLCMYSALVWYRLRFTRRIYYKIKNTLLKRK